MGLTSVLGAVIVLLLMFSGSGLAQTLTPLEQLGKSIFFDQNLSINHNQSCASCHAPEAGWTGPDSAVNDAGAVYEGSIPGRFGNRKPPSAAYATQSPIFHLDKKGLFVGGNFWDGRATGENLGNPAADQAQGPFLNQVEQALDSAADVVSRVLSADYQVKYEDVFGEYDNDVNKAFDNIALAIAAYEASPEVNAFTSKFDFWRRGQAVLTPQEARGFALFQGKGKCAKCHVSKGPKPLFTDFTYDNLGIPRNPDNPFYESEFNPEGEDWIDEGLGGFLATRSDYASYAAANRGKHKVPTLRNVDKRPSPDFVKAYGHNGYFKSLEEIVHFYNTRDVPGAGWNGQPWPPPEVPENVNTTELGNLGLTPEEEAAIVAFLKTLSDGYTP